MLEDLALSADGSEHATHYGLHAWTDDQFKSWIEGTASLPEGMESAQPVIDALISSFRADGEHYGHFSDVMAGAGLLMVEGGA